MGKKRKSEGTGLDEVDKTMYTTFCSAANSLSQLYTQAQNQQKLAFQAGERHGMEKLYQWILRQHQEGSRVTAADIVAYLENELDCGGEEPLSTPGSQMYPQNPQTQMPYSNPGAAYSASVQAVAQGTRPSHSDPNRNSIFSNALSSPVRRSLQPFHLAQANYLSNNAVHTGSGGGRRPASLDADQSGPFSGLQGSLQDHDISNESHPQQNRESHSFNSNDSSMDTHED